MPDSWHSHSNTQAYLQTRVGHSSDTDRALQSYFRMTFHPGEVRMIPSAAVFGGGKPPQVFVSRGLSGDAEMVNTWGMSGRDITLREAASKELSQHTLLFSVTHQRKGHKLQDCNNMIHFFFRQRYKPQYREDSSRITDNTSTRQYFGYRKMWILNVLQSSENAPKTYILGYFLLYNIIFSKIFLGLNWC